MRALGPVLVIAVAISCALLHMTPYWHAQSQVPPGWTFTGDIHGSPDYLQYRAWMRQVNHSGMLVDNRFTTEPNKPHLLVMYYYVIGKIASWTGFSPELVYAYSGSLFAFGFAVLLFFTVRCFFEKRSHVWWVLLIILLGGGLGGHLKMLSQYKIFTALRENVLIQRTLIDAIWANPVFEDYRGLYVVITFFDSHFMLQWLVGLASVAALYVTLTRFTVLRLLVSASLYLLSALLHIYSGVTLIAIALGVGAFTWKKGLQIRPGLMTLGICTAAAAGAIAWQVLVFSDSGMPMPSWRAQPIPLAIFLISFPVAWIVIAWGIAGYWRGAGFKEAFLVGWAAGCCALVFAGPFYPYPDRGTLTLQVPLYIIAGIIFFSRIPRITWPAVAVLVLLLGATPVWAVRNFWKHTAFRPNAPFMFLGPDHTKILHELHRRGSERDVLLVDKTKPGWQTDDRWLFPDFAGKLYCGHFFLTVDYERKRAEVTRFYSGNPREQAEFLWDKGIRFVYVEADGRPENFERVPGLRLLVATPVGSLFEYSQLRPAPPAQVARPEN